MLRWSEISSAIVHHKYLFPKTALMQSQAGCIIVFEKVSVVALNPICVRTSAQ